MNKTIKHAILAGFMLASGHAIWAMEKTRYEALEETTHGEVPGIAYSIVDPCRHGIVGDPNETVFIIKNNTGIPITIRMRNNAGTKILFETHPRTVAPDLALATAIPNTEPFPLRLTVMDAQKNELVKIMLKRDEEDVKVTKKTGVYHIIKITP